ncbi:MAG TPA: HAD-IA family hydrolase [Candidatus Limnocylindria bacterium]|nr:HAD-IA family hydrolase [Candidatus Limnocylindria bacterium]
MRRALLVDIDDTVVDWMGPAHDAVVTSIATHRSFAERDPSAVADRFMEIVEETHGLWMAGELSVDQLRAERIRRLVRETGNEIDPDEALVLADAYRRAYLAARRPVAGAGELLAEVRRRGARVVAVTNNLVSEQEDKLRHTNLRHLFDDLVISEAAGVNKPDPAIFEIALRVAGAAPSEAVMLGDSWENDVVGALGMGIAAAWLDRRGLGVPDPNVPVLALSSLEPADEVAAALLAA